MELTFSDLCERLEAERHSIAYRRPAQPISPVVAVSYSQADQDRRDRLMFAAGRYSAGARDKVAVLANEWLEAQP